MRKATIAFEVRVADDVTSEQVRMMMHSLVLVGVRDAQEGHEVGELLSSAAELALKAAISEPEVVKMSGPGEYPALEELKFSARVRGRLYRYGIHTIKQLLGLTATEMALWPGLGPSSLEEIECKLSLLGLRLKREVPTDIEALTQE